MASAGDMLNMMSPWAITKKVKKPVDPVEAIMKNRSKLKKDARRDDDGVAKEEMSTSKERKALKQTARRFCPPAHDVGVNDVGGKKQKSKASPESTEGDARVTKKAKTGTGSEPEMSKPKKKVATQGSGDHAPANVNDDGGARRPEQLTSPGTRYSLHERAYTVCTAQENSARSAFCVVMARLALPASGNSLHSLTPSAPHCPLLAAALDGAGHAAAGAPKSDMGMAIGCAFQDLEVGARPLSDAVLCGIAKLGFTATTPVQQATIPLLLNNKDVAVQACTGSGTPPSSNPQPRTPTPLCP
jgi:hypothetical protein